MVGVEFATNARSGVVNGNLIQARRATNRDDTCTMGGKELESKKIASVLVLG